MKSRQPNFFLLGGVKCASSSLAFYLRQHPDIFLTKMKEPHFFDLDSIYNDGFDEYLRRHFQKSEKYKIRGEATPNYFHRPEKVIPRIMEMHSDPFSLKFCIIFRNPIARAISHYKHVCRNQNEKLPFLEALKCEEKRLQNNPDRWIGYFKDGLYATQLEIWLKHFEKNQFHYVFFDDLIREPQETLNKIFLFLNIDIKKIDTSKKINRASTPRNKFLMSLLYQDSTVKTFLKNLVPSYYSRTARLCASRLLLKQESIASNCIDNSTYIYLLEKYKEDILKLEKLTKRDLSKWLKENALENLSN